MEALLNNPGVVGAIIIFILMAGNSLTNFSKRQCSCKHHKDDISNNTMANNKTQQQEHSNTTDKQSSSKVHTC